MYCKKCGNQLISSSSFCSKCGQKVVQQPLPVPRSQPEKPKNGLKKVFGFLMILSVLLFIATIAVLLQDMDKRVDVENIMSEGVQIDDEVFTDWEGDAYSLESIVQSVNSQEY